MENQEIWKDVEGYEGLYQVSNIGSVKSLTFAKERILKAGTDRGGYMYVILCNATRRYIRVHQLVAVAFLDHVPCGHTLVVDHRDFNKTNNRASNLRIITNRKNCNQIHIESTSQYIGVTWHKQAKKWQSQIHMNGKSKYLGLFINEEDAAIAYCEYLYSSGTVKGQKKECLFRPC